jgi:4-amino-4-deoxy-L-arabinose transferase-like glycosyltransferase
MLLAACVTAVWIAVARETLASEAAARSGAPPPRPPRWPGIHFALALGVLVKGPVMLAWALGGSLAAALCARSRAPLQWIGRWQGWLLFLLIAGGWFALALERHPEYLRYAFVDESLRRMTTSAFAREQPPWFVPVVLAAGALPWSLATPWGRGLGVVSRVGLGFVLFAAVFFTLSRSKLVTYLLPALPMLAWIAAEAWSGRRRAALGAVRLCIVFVALALTALLFGAREGWWGARLAPELVAHGMAAARGVALACVALAGLAFLAARGPRPGLAVLAAALFTPALLVIGGAAGARFARAESGEPLAGAILAHDARARVRYEHCYSPGTDFLLGRGGWFVSETGHEFTSNYQIYYRETLEARGLWVPSRRAEDAPPAGVIVRPARRRDLEPPDGWVEFHRDRRFVAYHPGPERR